jgi:hypothetical protein
VQMFWSSTSSLSSSSIAVVLFSMLLKSKEKEVISTSTKFFKKLRILTKYSHKLTKYSPSKKIRLLYQIVVKMLNHMPHRVLSNTWLKTLNTPALNLIGIKFSMIWYQILN